MDNFETKQPSPPSEPPLPPPTSGYEGNTSSSVKDDNYTSKYLSTGQRYADPTVFHVDNSLFISNTPRPLHWSVVWSDLMMTMFIFFVIMFTYKAANKDFLVGDELSVIGGDTTAALEIAEEGGRASLPFVPIKPGLPIITGGTVKKVESVQIHETEAKSGIMSEKSKQAQERIKKAAKVELAKKDAAKEEESKKQAEAEAEAEAKAEADIATEPLDSTAETIKTPAVGKDQMQEMFSLSQENLENYNLEKFAAIDLVPDKTVRIVLTGDLFFDTGQAELSNSAKESLKKITDVIRKTPYMINVVGHTDNIPMHSERFSTNWELSVARASRVARFLIEELGMDPNQFVVSGYGSYRPLKPNSDTRSRAANRRVEIIISKKLPPPTAATPENIQ